MFDKTNSFFHLETEDDMDNPGFVTLMTQDEENEINKEEFLDELPMLPLRNTVLFPGVIFPITLGRDKSIKLIKDAYKSTKTIGVVSQKDSKIEDPTFDDLHRIGTVAHIVKMIRMPDGNTTAIIQGKRKFRIQEFSAIEPYFKAKVVSDPEDKYKADKNFKALLGSVKELATKIVELSPNIPTEANFALKNIDSPNFLINFIASNLNVDIAKKQSILELKGLPEKAEEVLHHLTKELQMLELKTHIQSKVKVDLDKQQREYFLHQQIRAIQEELGQESPDKEIESLRLKGKKKDWPGEVSKVFFKELDKLQRTNPAAPDYSVSLNYVELLLELPWNEYTKDSFDLARAKKTLDADHFGLEKVKDRILEYLAVLKLKGDMKSPILCLYGPPGVGKTSLGKSIAKAVGRKYVRMSLGGLHDEEELRGH
ncbi:MAG: ATP-dependent Lon protease, partial [Bacteroidia bacterium]